MRGWDLSTVGKSVGKKCPSRELFFPHNERKIRAGIVHNQLAFLSSSFLRGRGSRRSSKCARVMSAVKHVQLAVVEPKEKEYPDERRNTTTTPSVPKGPAEDMSLLLQATTDVELGVQESDSKDSETPSKANEKTATDDDVNSGKTDTCDAHQIKVAGKSTVFYLLMLFFGSLFGFICFAEIYHAFAFNGYRPEPYVLDYSKHPFAEAPATNTYATLNAYQDQGLGTAENPIVVWLAGDSVSVQSIQFRHLEKKLTNRLKRETPLQFKLVNRGEPSCSVEVCYCACA